MPTTASAPDQPCSQLDREGAEACLTGVERALGLNRDLRARLEQVVEILGRAVDAHRVVMYGASDPYDDSVRVRVSWRSSSVAPFGDWIGAIPLLTEQSHDDALVVRAPRGIHCPPDCTDVLPDCALRGHCSSILQPLRVGDRHFGALAIHGATGRAWSDLETATAERCARRIAVEIAQARVEALQGELEAERQSIATTVLHQLATPITIISGALQHMEDAHQDVPPLLRAARGECDRLDRLCHDLTAIVTAGPDPRVAGRRTCDVIDAVAAARRIGRARHEHAAIAVTVVGEVPSARCDGASLTSTLVALIDNSVRYALADAAVHVELLVWADAGHVVIRVRDDGPGITSTEAERLGHPFTRLDPDMRRQPGGVGLGLALARTLARDGAGSLRVEPRTDHRGTQVTITLAAVDAPSSMRAEFPQ